MTELEKLAARPKRNWRGQFVKKLRMTPDGSREWLIWSRYHGAWHCRCESTGGAAGYTTDIARAGLFDRSKASSYNDGDRNEAFHVSEKAEQIDAKIDQLTADIERLRALSAALRAHQQGEGRC